MRCKHGWCKTGATSYRQAASVGTSVWSLIEGGKEVIRVGVRVSARPVDSACVVFVCVCYKLEVIYGTMRVADSVEKAMDLNLVI